MGMWVNSVKKNEQRETSAGEYFGADWTIEHQRRVAHAEGLRPSKVLRFLENPSLLNAENHVVIASRAQLPEAYAKLHSVLCGMGKTDAQAAKLVKSWARAREVVIAESEAWSKAQTRALH